MECEKCKLTFLTEADPYMVIPTSKGTIFYCHKCASQAERLADTERLLRQFLKYHDDSTLNNEAFESEALVWIGEVREYMSKHKGGKDE